MEKQWKKRQEIWDQEERARVKLIHEVYADRENALRYKKGLNNQELVEKAEEKDELHVFVEKFHTEEKRQELEDIMVIFFVAGLSNKISIAGQTASECTFVASQRKD